MPRFHCAKAISACYSNPLYFRFNPPIMEWDKSSGTFFITDKNSPRNILWMICVLTVNGAISCSCGIFTIYHRKHFSFNNLIVAWILFLIGTFDVKFVLNLHRNCDCIALAFHRIKNLAPKEPSMEPPETGRKVWRIVGFLLRVMVVEMAFMDMILPAFIIWQKADPFYNVCHYYQVDLHLSPEAQTGLFIFRFILVEIFFIESLRIYGLFVATIFYWFEIQSKCIQHLERMAYVLEHKFFSLYAQCVLCAQTWSTILADWVLMMLTALFFLSVSCAIVSVRYLGKIPAPVYTYAVCVGLIDLATIYMAFPFLSDPLEKTEKIIWERKWRIRTCRFRRLCRMQTWAMRPISVKLGRAFVVKRKTKSAFYSNIIDCTLNGILLKRPSET